ncbi:C39 family peptidase [bacterium]|nr:C39 family peptidase [bacterium]
MQTKTEFAFEIQPQPNDVTCGPTCLQAVYQYYGDDIHLDQVIQETPKCDDGGTLAVLLAQHAIARGYQATIYSYNLQAFDPTWFTLGADQIKRQLIRQLEFKTDPKLNFVIQSYIQFIECGGILRFDELKGRLLQKYLTRERPILTGLSSTYLYQCARERPSETNPHASEYDDLRGEPTGHFVILRGYDKENRKVLVADPLYPNPIQPSQNYEVGFDRLICSILLGTITYDSNLLIIEPQGGKR